MWRNCKRFNLKSSTDSLFKIACRLTPFAGACRCKLWVANSFQPQVSAKNGDGINMWHIPNIQNCCTSMWVAAQLRSQELDKLNEDKPGQGAKSSRGRWEPGDFTGRVGRFVDRKCNTFIPSLDIIGGYWIGKWIYWWIDLLIRTQPESFVRNSKILSK